MQLTIAMHTFNEKLRQMNQSNGKQLVLSAQEARNLHADIFTLMAEVTTLSTTKSNTEETVTAVMDGGGFRG
jgi:hypothetical protein